MRVNPPGTEQPAQRQRAFESERRSLLLGRVRVGAVVCAAVAVGGAPLDGLLAPETVGRLLAFRGVSAGGALALLAASFLPALARLPRLLSLVFALWTAAGTEALAFASGGLASPFAPGVVLLLLALPLFLPWSGGEMAGMAVALGALHLLPYLDVPGQPLAVSLYWLLNAGAVGVAGAWVGHHLRRREFLARTDLEGRTRELRETSGNLRATVGRLREVDRARSQLVANVSHELRTPLTVLRAVLEELGEQTDLTPAVARRLEVMRGSAQSLLWRINDLLELAQAEVGRAEVRREPVDLPQLVEAAVAEQRPFAERFGVHLSAESAGAPVVAADLEKLETVLRNLLSNALKFTPEGGRVTVRCREEEAHGVLEVEDTGVGVRPEDRERIFERFARVSDSLVPGVRGSGIGLALVRELVQLHGGEVALVEGAPGRGSLFRVRLPRTSGAAEPSAELRRLRRSLVEAGLSGWDELSALPAGVAPASAPRVLVAEDHPDLRRFLVGYLAPHFQVEAACDGQEALERVRAWRPDLVVSDVMMPRLSGYGLAQALRGDPATADIPLLLLTAQRGTDATVQGLAEGADDYLPKPFSPRELLARVQARLRVRELSRQLAQAQRMAMLGTLSAGLAHEVRNPVNAIVNALAVVRDALADGTSGERAVGLEMADVIDEASRRIVRLVDDLLGFTRRSAEVPGAWSPDEGVEATLKLLQHRLGGTAVQRELMYGGQVRGFPDRLNQVVMNLLDNALRAAGPAGTVRVRTERLEGGVVLRVEDDGPGIASEVLPRIFDPFFTTREVGQGTGLGLHLSRQIAEAHGGTLSAESRPGHGATFTLWLPEEERPRLRA